MYTVAEMHKVVVTLVVASLMVVVAVLSRVTSDSTATRQMALLQSRGRPVACTLSPGQSCSLSGRGSSGVLTEAQVPECPPRLQPGPYEPVGQVVGSKGLDALSVRPEGGKRAGRGHCGCRLQCSSPVHPVLRGGGITPSCRSEGASPLSRHRVVFGEDQRAQHPTQF